MFTITIPRNVVTDSRFGGSIFVLVQILRFINSKDNICMYCATWRPDERVVPELRRLSAAGSRLSAAVFRISRQSVIH